MSNAEQAYESVRKLIGKIIKSHQQRFGGSWDDLLSEANELFMLAHTSYDPARGTYAKRIAYKVWYGLLEKLRSQTTERRKFVPLSAVQGEIYRDSDTEISDETRRAINIALEMPNPTKTRLKKELRSLGWNQEAINQTFMEARQFLHENNSVQVSGRFSQGYRRV